MIQAIPAESIPQITRVSADTIVLAPHSDSHPIARIIAGNWNEPGQAIPKRPIVITAIRDRHGSIDWLSIHLDGSPARGHVIVGLCDSELAVRVGYVRKIMGRSDTSMLNHWARQIVAAAWGSEAGR